MSATWRRSSPYKTKPMNSVIRSDGRVVVQDETGIAGNEIHTRGSGISRWKSDAYRS